MTRLGRIPQIFSLLLLSGCTIPFINGTDQAAPIPRTPDYSGMAFDTATPILTPSPLPSETITPTATRDLGWTPSPTPEPTYSPFRWDCGPDGSPHPCPHVL